MRQDLKYWCNIINNNKNKDYLWNFQNGLQVLWGVSFQNHLIEEMCKEELNACLKGLVY